MLISCASQEKKGDKLLAKGNFEKAERHYAKALKKDPQNAELKTKLSRAKDLYMEDTLYISLELRQQSQLNQWLKTLNKLTTKKDQWQYSMPDQYLIDLYGQELENARNHLYSEVNNALERNHPDKTPLA